MMRAQLEKLRKAPWLFRQPLTLRPGDRGSPVSDLFIWRVGAAWNTCFELVDIPALFAEQVPAGRYATIVFFDASGREVRRDRLDVVPQRRQTLDLSRYVDPSFGSAGTFAVFHSHTPAVVTELGAFLAERGYTSYAYGNAPLRSYVHGNLDAVAQGSGGDIELLGARSVLPREYRLQHEIVSGPTYELGMVNPTRRAQRIRCDLVDASRGTVQATERALLPPGGLRLFTVAAAAGTRCRVIIRSRLVMARPLVFRKSHSQLDVFHG